ncbi:hypothetical protein OCC_07666 [Thermococcus litoralis DSM 5473]|uniref:Uncharacterized protein n=1 Tax=Thermococcus litoralis (strain ATCC 51850 / DSM 5473 / JCM 8560 / NS-C) TaxID=523849 RepID=H3ZL20_THELN|nr:hypothetical protein [Thermococcus litoralis]EHR79359.1 hypothetical protein OCC_07666 [Thermococcus litoralis DSM 5473]
MVAIGKEIIKRVTGTQDPVETTLHILQSFGKENDREFVKEFSPDNPKLENYHQHILVYYPKYEDFYRNHKEEFANRATESIERILGRKLTSEERQKLRRAFELAAEYGKRFHDMFRGVDESMYHMVAESAEVHRTEGFKAIEYAEKTLGVDLLEKVGDTILELNKLFPGFSKPEEVYGDRWYEFLKKKGIDPKILEPAGAKSNFTQVQKKDVPKWILETVPEGVRLEVLSLVKAVKLVGSPEARSKATEELREKVEEIAEGELNEEAFLRACLYALAAELIAREKEDKLEKLLGAGS